MVVTYSWSWWSSALYCRWVADREHLSLSPYTLQENQDCSRSDPPSSTDHVREIQELRECSHRPVDPVTGMGMVGGCWWVMRFGENAIEM